MRVAVFLPPGAHALEIAGPLDVFAEASRQLGGAPAYVVNVVATGPGLIECASGLRVLPDQTIADPDPAVDTLIVIGPDGSGLPNPPVELVRWLLQTSAVTRRFGSVCTGAFLLGAAGLLDGRHVTTHWEFAVALAAAFPRAVVEMDRIFVRDGKLFTSAGVTAGIDLALALVEEDHGRDLALAVARRMVMFLKRPGGQSQFSVQLAGQIAGHSAIQHVQQWVRDRPDAKMSIAALAQRAGMSIRNFSRVFRKEAGMTPADFVEASRVDTARRLLEETTLPLSRIASMCGFAGADGLRRAFRRRMDVGPLDYRARFRSTRDNGLRGH
jgi:transcriptional regulator GlxA family with amidase domain